MSHPSPKLYPVAESFLLTFLEPLVQGLSGQDEIGSNGELTLRVEIYKGEITKVRKGWDTTVFKRAHEPAMR